MELNSEHVKFEIASKYFGEDFKKAGEYTQVLVQS